MRAHPPARMRSARPCTPARDLIGNPLRVLGGGRRWRARGQAWRGSPRSLVRRPDPREAEAQLAAANAKLPGAWACAGISITGSAGSRATCGQFYVHQNAALALGASRPKRIDGGRCAAGTRQHRASASCGELRKSIYAALADVKARSLPPAAPRPGNTEGRWWSRRGRAASAEVPTAKARMTCTCSMRSAHCSRPRTACAAEDGPDEASTGLYKALAAAGAEHAHKAKGPEAACRGSEE